MKKFTYLLLAIFVLLELPISTCLADKKSGRSFNQSPVSILNEVKDEANKDWDKVQDTKLDPINSKSSNELGVDSRFTITKTLNFIKDNIHDYLQYVMFFGFSLATLFLVWNGFKLVTSQDREKEIKSFTKKVIYTVIWVLLLVCFYYIIDIFVSIVNLMLEN